MPQMGPLPWAGVSIVVLLVTLSSINYLYFLVDFGIGHRGSTSRSPWRSWEW